MLDSYTNIEKILSDNLPHRGKRFSSKDLELLSPITNTSNFGYDDNDVVELHVYSETGNYLAKTHNIKTWIPTKNNSYTNNNVIKLDVQNDLRNLNFKRGIYKFVYNFNRNIIGSHSNKSCFIFEVSGTRQEIRCKLTDKTNKDFLFQLSELNAYFLSDSNYFYDFAINFGDNVICKIINFEKITDDEFKLKLYEELPNDIDVSTSFWVIKDVLEPYIDNIRLVQKEILDLPQSIKGPNFDVDVDYVIGSETAYKSWSDLVGSNTATSQNIVDTYFSSSIESIKTNINYSEFKNFVHFGSATERIENFYYKIKQIEKYNTNISLNSSLNGYIGNTEINDTIKRNEIISTFDDFEKYLYFQASGSLYSNIFTSSVKPFPKKPTNILSDSQSLWIETAHRWQESSIIWALESQNSIEEAKYPYTLFSHTSSDAIKWYNETLNNAIQYDKENIYSLVRTIPENILLSSDNDSYILFVEMIGHHFDIIWTYINELGKIHTREENPSDGVSNDLLYDIAKGYGWTLSNGNTTKDLWEYALGTNENNEKKNSNVNVNGIRTKSAKERTNEIWRRIVNNLPFLLKTKGTSRSVRALINTYGIPNTILREYEYSGLTRNGIKPKLNLDKYTYATVISQSNQYVSVPWKNVYSSSLQRTELNDNLLTWGNIPTEFDLTSLVFGGSGYNLNVVADQKPSSVCIMFKPLSTKDFDYSPDKFSIWSIGDGENTKASVVYEKNFNSEYYGNIHFYLSGSNGYKTSSINDVYILDGTFNNVMVRRLVNGNNNDIDQTYELYVYKEKYGKIVTCESSSLYIEGSSNTESASYNASWNSDGILYIAKDNASMGYSSSNVSIQEFRYWNTPLNTSSFQGHTLSPKSYYGNTEISTFDNLSLRIPFNDVDIRYSQTQSIKSIHPSKNIIRTFSDDVTELKANVYNLTDDSYESFNQTQYLTIPSLGPNNVADNKIEIISNSIERNLNANFTSEIFPVEQYPYQSNRVRVALSPQDMINEDIYYHTGYFEIDNYIGDPENEFSVEYSELKRFSENYWKKYSGKNNINAYFELLKIFDFSLFKQVEQLLPFRANKILGLLWQQTALERSKQKSFSGIVISNNTFEGNLYNLSVNDITSSIKETHKSTFKLNSSLTASYDNYKGNFSSSLFTINVENRDYNVELNTATASLTSEFNSELSKNNVAVFDSKFDDSSKYIWFNYRKENNTWRTELNSKDIRESVVEMIDTYPKYSYYQETKGFYSSSYDMAINLPYSVSMQNTSFTPPDDLETSTYRRRYGGSVVGNARNSRGEFETPDGKPAIEMNTVNGNQMITQNLDSSGSIRIR